MWEKELMIAVGVVISFGIGLSIWHYIQISKTLTGLEKMLAKAKEGRFDAGEYDESRISRLEAGFYHVFSNSSLSKRRLEEEEEKIKNLIGDISHQTKTPIANIRLYTELLKEEKLPDMARDLAEQIEKQSEKLEFLIQALVKMSRLENGVLQINPVRASLKQILQNCVDAVCKKAEEKQITLEWYPDFWKDIFVQCDPKWTQEAIFNILENAVKYTQIGGIVCVRIKAYPMFARIEIEDNGIGIAEEEQSQIFLRFYRGRKVSAEEGVGIGLYLARQIISAEDGYIRLISRNGEGSSFSICLPKYREEEVEAKWSEKHA